MKKKIALFLTTISLGTTTAFLAGCNLNKDTKTHLDYGTIRQNKIASISEISELGYDDLLSKTYNKESFMLALYNPGCGCWTDFQPVLIQYINNNNVNIDYMSVTEFQDKEDNLGLYLVKGDMPSLAIFSKGKLVIQSVYIRDDREMFKNYDRFSRFVNENVYLPKMYYLEKEVLDSYISSDKEFNLYIGRNGCPDCKAAQSDVLLPWSQEKATINDNLYIFDMQPYYPGKDATQEVKDYYQELKDLYGLSEKNNSELGYSTGMVPTFQRRKGAKVTDMCVVLNDSRTEDKTISSYFTKDRVSHMSFLNGTTLADGLNGMQLTDEQYENWRSYKSTYYSTYHYPILKQFISTYIK